MPSNALAHFKQLLKYVDQLVAIHARVQTGRGRRHRQDAIHRAGVVLVVAAWEAYIEQVILEAYGAIEVDAGLGATGVPIPAWARQVFKLQRKDVSQAVKKLHTPNATGVRDIFLSALDFNPWPSWSWISKRRNWNSEEMRRRLNHWLDIRHSVAHGALLPADIAWIQGAGGAPRLNLKILKECKAFFQRLAEQTDTSVRAHLVTNHGVASPW